MPIGEILTKAARILWKHKVLWVFGILASFGQAGGSSSGGGRSSSSPGQTAVPTAQLESVPAWVWMLVAAGILALLLILAFLAALGNSGLIIGTRMASGTDERLGFTALLRESLRFVWRIFWLKFLVVLLGAITAVLLFLPALAASVLTAGLAMLCGLPAFCILVIPALVVLSVILELGINAVVLEDTNVFSGLQSGWSVFKRYLGPILLLALILSAISAALQFVLALPALAAFVPLWFQFITGSDQFFPAAAISIGLLCLYLPVLLLGSGILSAYQGIAWTLAYLNASAPSGGMR